MLVMPFSQTLACSLEDFPEWRKGRMRYGVWIVRGNTEVDQHIQHARQHLGTWLHPKGARQSHITVFVCGFLSKHVLYDDDFSAQQLSAQISELQQHAPHCFELSIGGLNSFNTTAFLEVKDPSNGLEYIRSALSKHTHEIRQSTYIPHVTVGLYREAVSRNDVLKAFRQLTLPHLVLRVDCLEFVSFDAQDPQGELTVEYTFQLS